MIAVCSDCSKLYDAGSEEQAYEPGRMCPGCAAAWREYDSAAEWCARRGIAGEVGDRLPQNMSAAACALIDADPEAFERRVRESAYALAMEARPDPENPGGAFCRSCGLPLPQDGPCATGCEEGGSDAD